MDHKFLVTLLEPVQFCKSEESNNRFPLKLVLTLSLAIIIRKTKIKIESLKGGVEKSRRFLLNMVSLEKAPRAYFFSHFLWNKK